MSWALCSASMVKAVSEPARLSSWLIRRVSRSVDRSNSLSSCCLSALGWDGEPGLSER